MARTFQVTPQLQEAARVGAVYSAQLDNLARALAPLRDMAKWYEQLDWVADWQAKNAAMLEAATRPILLSPLVQFGDVFAAQQRQFASLFQERAGFLGKAVAQQIAGILDGVDALQQSHQKMLGDLFGSLRFDLLGGLSQEELSRLMGVAAKETLEVEANLPEGPRPSEPVPTDAVTKMAFLAIVVSLLVVARKMNPDDGAAILNLLASLLGLILMLYKDARR